MKKNIYTKELKVTGNTIFEKQEKLINIRKCLEKNGAKTSYEYHYSIGSYLDGWMEYKLGRTEIVICVEKPTPLDFLFSHRHESDKDTGKETKSCSACHLNMKYTIKIKSPENIDKLVEELSSLT